MDAFAKTIIRIHWLNTRLFGGSLEFEITPKITIYAHLHTIFIQFMFTHTGISNIEIIRNIKKDCESSEHHVLCPKTFACIAKDFLCDGDNGKIIARCLTG